MSRVPYFHGCNNDNGPLPVRVDKDSAPVRSHPFFNLPGAVSWWGLLAILICFTPAAGPAQNAQSGLPSPVRQGLSAPLDDDRVTRSENSERLTPKQKQSIVHANLERSKRDATELAALAKELREELDEPNVDALSLEGMNRIEKIGKLAKKIRDETKGF